MSFPRVCTPLRSLLICPCVFDQAPGVLPVRHETIEGIDGCVVQRMHLDGAQRSTRRPAECNECIELVCNAAHGSGLRPFGPSCGWVLAVALRATAGVWRAACSQDGQRMALLHAPNTAPFWNKLGFERQLQPCSISETCENFAPTYQCWLHSGHHQLGRVLQRQGDKRETRPRGQRHSIWHLTAETLGDTGRQAGGC